MFRQTVNRYRNILHLRFQPAFSAIPPEALNNISPGNFLQRVKKVIFYTIGRLGTNIFTPAQKIENIEGKIWLYVVSQNNVDALQFLKSTLPETVFIAGQKKQIGRYNHIVNRLSLRLKFFYTAAYFLPVFFGLRKIYGNKVFRFLDLIFISIGYYEQYLKHIEKYKPKAIIFANDHNDDARAMLLAAKKCSIPTIYIQHASVSSAFPPLEFDLSLLEGQDALDKYRQCGPVYGKVALIGMPKADKYLKYRNFKNIVETVGISGNLLDDFDGLKKALVELTATFTGLKFIFRPHPGDIRDFNFVKELGDKVIVSDPKLESAFEYLQKIDLLIAADSSIHLEAALLNIPSIYFRFGETNFTYDYYGYVGKELVEEAETISELMELINKMHSNKPEVFKRTTYYNAVVGTESEGQSEKIAVAHIVGLLNKLY